MKKFISKKKEVVCRKGGLPSKAALYNRIAYRADELIDRLFELTKSGNENVAVSAARTLLERVLPVLNSNEIKDENIEKLEIQIIEDKPKTEV